jgi:hypothetical protein
VRGDEHQRIRVQLRANLSTAGLGNGAPRWRFCEAGDRGAKGSVGLAAAPRRRSNISVFSLQLAVAVLPEDSRGRPNLKEHFERSNRLFFGVYGALVLLTGVMPHANRMLTGRAWEVPWANLIITTLCVVAVFLRRRWLHALVILYLLLRLNQDWIGQVISD